MTDGYMVANSCTDCDHKKAVGWDEKWAAVKFYCELRRNWVTRHSVCRYRVVHGRCD